VATACGAAAIAVTGLATASPASAALSCQQALALNAADRAAARVWLSIGDSEKTQYWLGRAAGDLDACSS
jgi:hypothetical protein